VDRRIVLLHYSPISETVEGEALELYPFLGSSRLEDPISRFEVTAVFHGHAHKGTPEGKTHSGIPVFNVALPVLKASSPDRSPFRVFEVSMTATSAQAVAPMADRRQWGRRATDRVQSPAMDRDGGGGLDNLINSHD
jgi:hypothetical protein